MPSRVVARKPARLIPIFPGEEPYFDRRSSIPVNSANTARTRAGIYRAELVEILPVFNCARALVGGIPETYLYAWVYHTLKCRDGFLWEDGLDEHGEAYEFVHYTGTQLGDPIASLTEHVGAVIGEVPDPDVLEFVSLSRMIGSRVCISVKLGNYAVPSPKAEIAWFGEADHLRCGPHMVGLVTGVVRAAKSQSGWREELEARERERAAKLRPYKVGFIRVTNAVDEE